MVVWAWWQWALFVWGVSSVGGLMGFFLCAMLTVAKEADAHMEIIEARRRWEGADDDALDRTTGLAGRPVGLRADDRPPTGGPS